jgi:lipoprotein-anchoring transpeptidase ErfK/SrfK
VCTDAGNDADAESRQTARRRDRVAGLAAAIVCVVYAVLSAREGASAPPRHLDVGPQTTAPPSRYLVAPVNAATIAKEFTAVQVAILEKLNRRDVEHLIRLKEMIVPDAWLDDELSYSPLPAAWPWAAAMPKAIVVHQPSQVWGAYETGRLVRWGPVSSGRKETPTPAGVYSLTWKSKSRVSTDNDQWVLKWYFNFINARGISFHQFELPGLPASHACVRLLERDAIWLYDWGEQWTLTPDRRQVATPGTTVVIHGTYDFGRLPPWVAPEWWQTKIALPIDLAR